MSLLFRTTYPLAVIVLPLPLLLCWMYLRHAPGDAFAVVVALWIAATLLRDGSAYVLRWRESAMVQAAPWLALHRTRSGRYARSG